MTHFIQLTCIHNTSSGTVPRNPSWASCRIVHCSPTASPACLHNVVDGQLSYLPCCVNSVKIRACAITDMSTDDSLGIPFLAHRLT